MDLEPEEIEEERDNNQANSTSSKVLSKFRQRQCALAAIDIHKIPEVNHDRNTNREESEHTHVFDGDDTTQADTSQEKPLPPLTAERSMSELVEANVGKNREGHEENERSIEENQARLANMCVVEQHKTSCCDTGRQGVTRFPHD